MLGNSDFYEELLISNFRGDYLDFVHGNYNFSCSSIDIRPYLSYKTKRTFSFDEIRQMLNEKNIGKEK